MVCKHGQECSVGWNLRETDVACFEVPSQHFPSGLRNTSSLDTVKVARPKFGLGTVLSEQKFSKSTCSVNYVAEIISPGLDLFKLPT